MSTFVDGPPPSMTPRPADEPDHGDRTGGSPWLQDEIARMVAARSSDAGARHARRDNRDRSSAADYLPRHATATPGPAAPVKPERPKLPRRGPAGANGDTEAWTGPDPSERRRPVLGAPSRQNGVAGRPSATGQPTRPSGPAAARLLSLPALPAPLPVDPPPGNPSAPTGAWPVTPARPLVPPGGVPAPGRAPQVERAPGPLTAPVQGGPAPAGPVVVEPVEADPAPDDGTGPPDEILWSASALPPATVDAPPPGAVAVPEQRGARFPPDPDPGSPRRVRVVLAERKGVARPVRTVVDIQEATAVGQLLRTNLIGSQLTVALRFAAGAGVTLGILPLLFALFPAIGEIGVFGLRLPWLLLGVLVYPFLLGLGWWHTRTAERVEQNFADHVQE